MIVKFDREEQTLYLMPQCEADQRLISLLKDAGMLVGMGRDCDGDFIHAEVKLAKPEKPS